MTLSTDDWNEIETILSSAFGSVKMVVDGYMINLTVLPAGPRTYVIAVYINGWIKGKWLIEDCEERRRFWRIKRKHLYKRKEREELRKWNKKYPGEKMWNPDAVFECYTPYWTSFSRLKTHLLKNNEHIEWIDRPEKPRNLHG